MSITINSAPTKRLSKAANKKREKAQYWRNIKICNDALEEDRELFLQAVVAVTLKTTDTAESFSAIIDSRRGIVIK